MADLTVRGLVGIVGDCLERLGAAPDGDDDRGDWEPADLELDDDALVQLFACIDQKVKARGQTVVLGKTMWRKSKTVRDFCEALVENLE